MFYVNKMRQWRQAVPSDTDELLHLHKRMGRYKMSGSPARPSFGVAPTSTIFFTVGWMQTLTYWRKEKNVKDQ